jgi:hypothetical protein
MLTASVEIQIPPLAIMTKNYEKNVALLPKSKFDLNNVINATLEDQKTYDSLSHLLYNELLDVQISSKNFDIQNCWDWVKGAASVAGILALVWTGILNYRLRALVLVMSSARTASAQISNQYPTLLRFQPSTLSTKPSLTTETPPNIVHDTLREFIPL